MNNCDTVPMRSVRKLAYLQCGRVGPQCPWRKTTVLMQTVKGCGGELWLPFKH